MAGGFTTLDAVVVGGGPAGISAATWLARHRRRVVLVHAGERRNRWVAQTHGYLGLDPIDPAELTRRGLGGLGAYPTAEVLDARVTGISGSVGEFTVETEPSIAGPLVARRLVLATGVVDEFPAVEGFFEHYGVSVFHCATCDGYEARNCDVVVFGWTKSAAGFALELLDWASSVTLVTDGTRFEGDEVHWEALERHGVPVLEDEAVALLGRRGSLTGVRLKGGRTLPGHLAFFSIAHRPRSELAEVLGCALTPERCIVVDGDGQTTVEGVYAAGDVTPGMQLVQVAAADGALAGVSSAVSLRGEPAVAGAPTPGPDAEAELAAD